MVFHKSRNKILFLLLMLCTLSVAQEILLELPPFDEADTGGTAVIGYDMQIDDG